MHLRPLWVSRRVALRRRAPRLPLAGASLLAALSLAAATGAFAAAVYHVAQQHRQFSAGDITIAAGDSVAFSNEDEFLHQIYVASTAMSFDSAEQHPGETITVRFPVAGTFPVRCHIHPKMLLVVHVK